MNTFTTKVLNGLGVNNNVSLAQQMKDYAAVGKNLIWQRQMTYVAALSLAGYYYSIKIAILTGCLIAVSEVYDYFVFRDIAAWKSHDSGAARVFLIKIFVGSMLSASIIVFYSVSIAIAQGPGAHFMSLFFLFAAALFAGMNNHQLLPILILRLTIYGSAFIFIPVWDIITTGASIDSELWAQLFTSIVVLYFVVDCSMVYLSFYRTSFNQIESLKAEHKKSQEAYKAKTEFLSTMSHELRTPLTAIKGSIDLAHAGHLGQLSDKAILVMDIAQRNCNSLVRLIDGILDLQKIEAGKMPFAMQPISLNDLVRDVVTTNQPFAQRLGVLLFLAPPEEALTVMGDVSHLSQVLTNMLSNAAKFSPEGTTVRIFTGRKENRARVCVIDEGIGLDQEDKERVFEKFSQLDSSDKRKIGGTGLGMNISREIMNAHDGIIEYESNNGQGTTFFMELDLISPNTNALI